MAAWASSSFRTHKSPLGARYRLRFAGGAFREKGGSFRLYIGYVTLLQVGPLGGTGCLEQKVGTCLKEKLVLNLHYRMIPIPNPV